MDCREFREKHCAFVDDTLPGIDLVRMQEHICDCRCCATQDAKVRKSLMLVRSLPSIEPSVPACDFVNQIQSRLNALPAEAPYANFITFKTGAAVMTLFGAMMVAYVIFKDSDEKARDIIFPPVIASIPEVPSVFEGIPIHSSELTKRQVAELTSQESVSESSPIETPGIEIFASVSAGMPIWPTVILAEQTPRHMANSKASVQMMPVGLTYDP